MTPSDPIPDAALRRLRRPVALTRLGLTAERALRAFWPLVTILLLLLAALMFGVQDFLLLEAVWIGGVASIAALAWSLWRGARRFRWPSRQEALERLDRTLPGRPIAAMRDHQAIGAGRSGLRGGLAGASRTDGRAGRPRRGRCAPT